MSRRIAYDPGQSPLEAPLPPAGTTTYVNSVQEAVEVIARQSFKRHQEMAREEAARAEAQPSQEDKEPNP